MRSPNRLHLLDRQRPSNGLSVFASTLEPMLASLLLLFTLISRIVSLNLLDWCVETRRYSSRSTRCKTKVTLLVKQTAQPIAHAFLT